MNDSAVQGVFKNATNALLFAHLEIALERVVVFGFKVTAHGTTQERLLNAIEEWAMPPIKGMINTLCPEISENIRKVGPQEIWRLYWDLRRRNHGISILEVFAEVSNGYTRFKVLRAPS